jgi:N-acetylglucosamine kinase-like BadF-type ATPase
MRGDLFAAIDGGGTGTRLVVVDAEGLEVLRLQGGTSNAAVAGHAAAGEVLAALLGDAISRVPTGTRFAAAWLGLSGGARMDDQRRLEPYVRSFAGTIRMTNDADLVLSALPGNAGVAVVAGTGSIAFGQNRDGGRARAGGWGHLFSDEGSGFDLARRMLAAYAAEVDGRGPATTLTHRLTSHFALAEPHDLVSHVYAPGWAKADTANLGRLVLEEAAAGDRVAQDILHRATSDLAGLVAAVGHGLGFVDGLPMAMTGSLLVHAEAVRSGLLEALRPEWPNLSWTVVPDPALAAARFLARETHPEDAQP